MIRPRCRSRPGSPEPAWDVSIRDAEILTCLAIVAESRRATQPRHLELDMSDADAFEVFGDERHDTGNIGADTESMPLLTGTHSPIQRSYAILVPDGISNDRRTRRRRGEDV